MARLMGSSPLTRGKRISLFNDLSQIRLIPAHAGKTGLKPPKTSRDTAHPRSRGENYVVFTPGVGQSGSSPLTRGKPTLTLRSVMSVRLIPAHAGKTLSMDQRPGTWWAHPRSRGENTGTSGPGLTMAGSSPLTRGKHRHLLGDLLLQRLIPAHAGKTGSRARSGRWRPGSSPLTRGKPQQRAGRSRPARLIPAHAGKTGIKWSVEEGKTAHPRSRGENLRRIPTGSDSTGSSPLTRGKLGLEIAL